MPSFKLVMVVVMVVVVVVVVAIVVEVVVVVVVSSLNLKVSPIAQSVERGTVKAVKSKG